MIAGVPRISFPKCAHARGSSRSGPHLNFSASRKAAAAAAARCVGNFARARARLVSLCVRALSHVFLVARAAGMRVKFERGGLSEGDRRRLFVRKLFMEVRRARTAFACDVVLLFGLCSWVLFVY